MPESIDDLLDEALAVLRKGRRQAKLMTGPVERWALPNYLEALSYMIRSLEPLNEALKRLGDAEGLPAHEALQHTELFYNRMLQLGNFNIGHVIGALRKREIPEDIVRAACVNAYLHPKVREAIKEGYGLMPLVPPEPKKPQQHG
ncbi:hypothetical protein HYY73_05375 [Candidatus Woesearchaeota archaeon]|nr:hypothetical protein [Candidatus Woesearchaeota archaeon]